MNLLTYNSVIVSQSELFIKQVLLIAYMSVSDSVYSIVVIFVQ